jgi:uncharacterized protein (TIGR02301 family)
MPNSWTTRLLIGALVPGLAVTLAQSPEKPAQAHSEFYQYHEPSTRERQRALPPRQERSAAAPRADSGARASQRIEPSPSDDLPPIEATEATPPPPPDDRPYDTQLLRLAEILGAIHFMRELCSAQEGQLWREQMQELIRLEGSSAARQAKLVRSFNSGYRGYSLTYRTCTASARLVIDRLTDEGAEIALALAEPSELAVSAID